MSFKKTCIYIYNNIYICNKGYNNYITFVFIVEPVYKGSQHSADQEPGCRRGGQWAHQYVVWYRGAWRWGPCRWQEGR